MTASKIHVLPFWEYADNASLFQSFPHLFVYFILIHFGVFLIVAFLERSLFLCLHSHLRIGYNLKYNQLHLPLPLTINYLLPILYGLSIRLRTVVETLFLCLQVSVFSKCLFCRYLLLPSPKDVQRVSHYTFWPWSPR